MYWDRYGVFLVDFLPRGATIISAMHCETLERLPRAIKNKRPGMLTKEVNYHHDNPRPHTANLTKELLPATEVWMGNRQALPCSPDVASSDYQIFPAQKEHHGGTRRLKRGSTPGCSTTRTESGKKKEYKTSSCGCDRSSKKNSDYTER